MIRRNLVVLSVPLLGLVLAGAIRPGLVPFGQSQDGRRGLRGGRSVSQDVDLATLGKDLTPCPFWTPEVDFSEGDKFYFDPSAAPGGDGSLDDPFQALGVEIARGTIVRCQSDTYTPANSGVVGPGDVCVLLDGNHGRIRFLRYYFADYLGIVAMPGHKATFDRFDMERGQRFFVQGLSYSGKPRWQQDDPGIMTDSGYDDKPNMMRASRDSNGNGVMEYVIIKDCDFSTGSAAEALGWSETAWDSLVCDALYLNRASWVHVQGNTGVALGSFARFGGSSSVTSVGINFVDNRLSHLCGDGFRVSCVDSVFVQGNELRDFYVVNNDHVDIFQAYAPTRNLVIDGNLGYLSTTIDRTPTDFGKNSISGYLFSAPDILSNAIISNNLLYTVGTWTAITVNGAVNTAIVNNTLVSYDLGPSQPTALIRAKKASTNLVIANNIAGSVVVPAGEGIILSNNREFSRDWSGAGFVSYEQNGDPTLFDFTPAVGSILISGADSAYLPAIDFYGTGRPVGLFGDIGAIEAPQ